LSSPIATLATKGEILTLLSIICTSSQKGSWLTLEAFNHFKLVNREQVRFEYLVYSMHIACTVDDTKTLRKENEEYLFKCLMFANALLSSLSEDISTRALLQKEFVTAKFSEMITRIREIVTDGKLRAQTDMFNIAMQDQTYLGETTEDPQEVSKAILSKLQGLPSQANFSHLLRVC
jgi:hypothetical protein